MPMTSEEIDSICTERLGRWQRRLVEQHATPILLLGAGHDHKIGQAVVCTTEEMTDIEVMIFIRGILKKMEEGQIIGDGHEGGRYGRASRN